MRAGSQGRRGQKRNLPRLRMSFGSNARLTARRHSRSVGEAPQGSRPGFAPLGQRSTDTETSRGTAARTALTALLYAAGSQVLTGRNANNIDPTPARPTAAQAKPLAAAACWHAFTT